MKYEDALQAWGKVRLERAGYKVDFNSVTVEMDFNEGYACCGGYDSYCCCSLAESPSAYVVIRGYWTEEQVYSTPKRKFQRVRHNERSASVAIDASDFDFATILGEIVDAGNGTLTN